MIAKNPIIMTKPELVKEAYRLGLGPSRAALDVHTKGALIRMIAEYRRQTNSTP